ncbi:MAG: hypothetical protein LBI05_00880 [Planctomycetaceae bacterium]|jgi:hypothetical protein|nr:hypothetical protein [Planctomycetaceae bacterium]
MIEIPKILTAEETVEKRRANILNPPSKGINECCCINVTPQVCCGGNAQTPGYAALYFLSRMGQLAYLGVGSQELELVAEDVTAMACITNNSVQAFIDGTGYRYFWGSTKVTNQDGTDFVPPSSIIGRTSGIVNDYWFIMTASSNATVYVFYKDKAIGNYYLSGSINYFARGAFATVYGANMNNWLLFSNGQRLTDYTGSLNNTAISLLGCGGVFFTVSGTTYYVYDEHGTQIDTFTSPSAYVSSVPDSYGAGTSAYLPTPPLALGAYSSDANDPLEGNHTWHCYSMGVKIGMFDVIPDTDTYYNSGNRAFQGSWAIYNWDQTNFLHWSRVRIRNDQGNITGYKIVVRDITGATIAVLAKESYSNSLSAMVYRYTGDVATCGVPSDGFLSVQEVYAPGNPYSPRAARIGLSLLVEDESADPSEWVSRVTGRRDWYNSTGAPSANCCGGKMIISPGSINTNPVLCDMDGGTDVNYLIQNCCYNAQSTVPKDGVPVLMTTNYLPFNAPYTREVRNADFEVIGTATHREASVIANFFCSCGTMIAIDKIWDFFNESWWLEVDSVLSTHQSCCGDILFYRLSYAQGRMASISEQRPVATPSTSWGPDSWTSEGGCCGGTRPFVRLANFQVWIWDTVFGQMIFDYSDLSRIA